MAKLLKVAINPITNIELMLTGELLDLTVHTIKDGGELLIESAHDYKEPPFNLLYTEKEAKIRHLAHKDYDTFLRIYKPNEIDWEEDYNAYI